MTFPVDPVTLPSLLAGQTNGALPDSLLVSTPGIAGGPVVRLLDPAARAWRAMVNAAAAAGHYLKATSAVDSYRRYDLQVREFTSRYTTTPLAGRPTKSWQGRTYWQRPGTAPAAVPGHSNHGWGIAVDTGEERDGNLSTTESLDAGTLDWLKRNAQSYGFSWELQSEPWHLRYTRGDGGPAPRVATSSPLSAPSTAAGLAGTAPATTTADPDGPFPTFGPSWLPWNWPSVVGNKTVDAGQAAGQAASGALLGGVRHIVIEGAVAVAGIGLLGLGLWRLTTVSMGKAGKATLRVAGGK